MLSFFFQTRRPFCINFGSALQRKWIPVGLWNSCTLNVTPLLVVQHYRKANKLAIKDVWKLRESPTRSRIPEIPNFVAKRVSLT